MNYYQFHIADFALHTSHLTLEEEGVLRRLLDFYYDAEKPIPVDTKQVVRRLRLAPHADVVAAILEEFFDLEDDGWHNKRADKEIAEYHAKADRARENGKSGGRPKKNKPAPQDHEEEPTETQPVILDNPEETGSKANQEPITINQEPITKNQEQESGLPPVDFQTLWAMFDATYGEKGAKANAEREFNKIKPDRELFAQMLDGLHRQIRDKAAKRAAGVFYSNFQNVERWLKNRRWTDEIDGRIAVPSRQDIGSADSRKQAALDAAFGSDETGILEADFERLDGHEADPVERRGLQDMGGWPV